MFDGSSAPKVLIVDDSEMYCYLAKLACKEAGAAQIDCAHTIHDALDAIDCDPPHACLLDARIGTELSTHVAQTLFDRGIPFTICTGDAPPEALAQFALEGYLPKPAPFERLVSTVRFLIAQSTVTAA